MERNDEEDARRETALAAGTLFQPNSKASRITEAQLDKLKELHKKRLQIKERSNAKVKSIGKQTKFAKESEDHSANDASDRMNDSKLSNSEGNGSLHEITETLTIKKRRKLHWGLDAKERWERKANM
ncbi:hypothetical protein J5N97_004111 [Dioscorea zingiberensis]|uniref:Uncharacterized protein n=1 Tax=Dioscorea zingiberensis TaxID=325984 RepID=A0A9D5HQN9_9LILI|nr:hypothetical protein J5N97_004111 [Dioscorea zingiberensis]